jgi:hypothetical protein
MPAFDVHRFTTFNCVRDAKLLVVDSAQWMRLGFEKPTALTPVKHSSVFCLVRSSPRAPRRAVRDPAVRAQGRRINAYHMLLKLGRVRGLRRRRSAGVGWRSLDAARRGAPGE